MGRTPDRQPGEALEEKLVLVDDGLTADNPGEVVYRAGSFSMRDSTGAFDPRSGGAGFDEDTILVDDVTLDVLADDVTGNVLVNE